MSYLLIYLLSLISILFTLFQMSTREVNNQEHIYRSTLSKDLIKAPLLPQLADKNRTLLNLWEFSTEKNSDSPAFGYRDVVTLHSKTIPEDHSKPDSKPKTWQTYELTDYKWITFKQARSMTKNIANGLHKLGINSGDHLLIFAKTSQDWMLTALACFEANITIVTAYDSMPYDAVLHTLRETGAHAILTDTSLMSVVAKVLQSAPDKQVHAVIYSGHESEGREGLEMVLRYSNTYEVVHIDSLKKGEVVSEQRSNLQKPTSSDVACIMYTSGSTGTPKGVEITHGSLVSTVGAAELLLANHINSRDDVYIGYLPLAHVLELAVEFTMGFMGVPIGYARVRTLSGGDSITGPGGEGKGTGDLKLLRPTLMAGVPMIWERIKKAMVTEVAKKGWFISTLFNAAIGIKWRLWNLMGRETWATKLIDRLIFARPREATGGRLRLALTGGAPISEETHKFLMTTLCFFLQGYGLTEVSGLGFITLPDNGPKLGTIGFPAPSIEVKLQDVPEAGYKADEGQGEMLLRGSSVMRGYFKQPKLTSEALTEDGWFKTGDIASINPDGTFNIIDRAKNLVKLANGEYIALEKLESVYRDNHIIKNICIIADSGSESIIAVVEPSKESDSDEQILSDLQKSARSSGLNKAETISAVIASRGKGEWMSNGFLTTSGKLKRREIKDAFKDEIGKFSKKHK